ncbi:MAG: C40 family peptidase [Actinomycetota bacterium]
MRWGRRGERVVVAVFAMALVVVPAIGSTASIARPDLAGARARLDALNMRLQVVDEAYNQAVIKLANTRHLMQLQQNRVGSAQKTLDQARSLLSAASADAYIEGANSTMTIMNANDLASLADRLDFLDNVTARHADLAQRASIAGKRAAKARGRLQTTLAAERATLQELSSMRAELQRGVAQAESLLQQIRSTSPGFGIDVVPRSSLRAPPAPNPGAQKALDAAYSVLGTPYRYAGASPSEGFDCSGLTMWSWAHAGVSLPHSAAAQYDSIVHVTRAELQPGDLVFFYQPISHVGMYVGNGQMIEAPHTGDHVKVTGVYWDSFVGAGRPGV